MRLIELPTPESEEAWTSTPLTPGIPTARSLIPSEPLKERPAQRSTGARAKPACAASLRFAGRRPVAPVVDRPVPVP